MSLPTFSGTAIPHMFQQPATPIVVYAETSFPHLTTASFKSALDFQSSCDEWRSRHPGGPPLPPIVSLVSEEVLASVGAEYSDWTTVDEENLFARLYGSLRPHLAKDRLALMRTYTFNLAKSDPTKYPVQLELFFRKFFRCVRALSIPTKVIARSLPHQFHGEIGNLLRPEVLIADRREFTDLQCALPSTSVTSTFPSPACFPPRDARSLEERLTCALESLAGLSRPAPGAKEGAPSGSNSTPAAGGDPNSKESSSGPSPPASCSAPTDSPTPVRAPALGPPLPRHSEPMMAPPTGPEPAGGADESSTSDSGEMRRRRELEVVVGTARRLAKDLEALRHLRVESREGSPLDERAGREDRRDHGNHGGPQSHSAMRHRHHHQQHHEQHPSSRSGPARAPLTEALKNELSAAGLCWNCRIKHHVEV